MQGEDALNANPKAHLANHKHGTRAGALDGDDGPLKSLDADFLAVFDAYRDADFVAGGTPPESARLPPVAFMPLVASPAK